MGDTAYIFAPENCDFCKMEGVEVQAQFDGKTVHGPWAYMCDNHFALMGVGLGTGRGQRLVVGERPKGEVEPEGMDDFPLGESATSSESPPEKAKKEEKAPQTDWGNLYP